jgi:hypothetical protein
MKIKQFLYASLLVLTFSPVLAQDQAPAGFESGSVTLADGSELNGFIKNNIKKSASVVFIDSKGTKNTWKGSQLNAARINGVSYICINGDFFKALSEGKINFLQKASDASGTISYNGTEAVVNSGTEGKIGDYFAYADNKLQLLNKTTVNTFINADLAVCAPALEKAKTINGDIAKLQEAVDIFNQN